MVITFPQVTHRPEKGMHLFFDALAGYLSATGRMCLQVGRQVERELFDAVEIGEVEFSTEDQALQGSGIPSFFRSQFQCVAMIPAD
jgi:hypothetical protein